MSKLPARASFGIGEVLAQLRADFPDVSVSKIRFLESEGLIRPARSPSGYRRFGPSDVQRLRYILTAQRDQYLPLRVIKDRLAAEDGGAGADPGGPPPRRARRPLSRRELLDAAGIDDRHLAELEDFGLVKAAGRQYGPDALDVARVIAALGRHGVQARHLRAVRAAVERETSLIEQVVAPALRQRSPGSRDRAGQTAREIAALCLQLHVMLMDGTLAEAGFPETRLAEAGFAGPGEDGGGFPGRTFAGPAFPDSGFAGPAAAGSGA